MRIKILLMTVVLMLSGFLSVEAQSRPCGCENKQDLLNLLNMSQMAIQELNSQLGLLADKEKTEGKPELFTSESYDKLMEKVSIARGDVKKGTVNYDFIQSDRQDCSFTENQVPNECLRQVSKSIINVYKKACDETKGLPSDQTPYRYMKQVILHEISANQEMQKFILQMLKSLPKTCRPNNWFGYVVYQEAATDVWNKTVPSKNTNYPKPGAGIDIIAGGSGTKIAKSTYIGTIIVEEGKASNARGYANSSLDDSTTVTGRVYCSPSKPDMSTVVTNGTKNFIEGTSEGNASFRFFVYPDKGKYSFDMDFFSVRGASGQMSDFRNISDGCGSDSRNHNNPISNAVLDGPNYYRIEEKINGSPDYLEGTKVEKPPLGQVNRTDGNLSWIRTKEIQVRWMLRRLPAK